MILDIETYEGHQITLDTDRGVFLVSIDEATLEDATLPGIKERFVKVRAKLAEHARKTQTPVHIVAIVRGKHAHRLVECCVLGVVAGRTHTLALRIMAQGEKQTLDLGWPDSTIQCLAPDSPRIPHIQAYIDAVRHAEQAWEDAKNALHAALADIPHVQVPETATKEAALDAEPAFLEALRAAIATK